MLSLQVEVNGTRVAVAGCADAETIDATVTIFPGLRESWVRVAGEIVQRRPRLAFPASRTPKPPPESLARPKWRPRSPDALNAYEALSEAL
jgi:hypothetical protein